MRLQHQHSQRIDSHRAPLATLGLADDSLALDHR